MDEAVLITGGTGFIGSYLTRHLAERGYPVIMYDIKEPGPEAAWILKPVLDKDKIRHVPVFAQGRIESWSRLFQVIQEYRPRKVIHMATIVNPVYLSREPLEALRVNLGGTMNILEAARLFKLQRIVYFSSIGVLPSVQYQPIDAAHPVLLPQEGPGSSFYGASKVAGEAFCFAYHQSFGLDFITLRPSAVYGFGMQWPIFIKPMVENSVRGLPTRFEKGREFPRDYTHVEDVTQLAIKALEIPADKVKDRIFYAATGQPLVTAGQVAEIVKSLIPDADIQIGSGLSEADLIEIRYRGILSIQNAQEQLGYQPRFTNIRDGVAEYIQTYRRYLTETRQSQNG
ncbi:MAG TPA: NAD(P)-dependent oxidoreductase [Candidatus Limnocylindrales bacterium]|nr:NAD(P)-dependent oxidoreductase [Candidatus Limnocylindrales bacterium]